MDKEWYMMEEKMSTVVLSSKIREYRVEKSISQERLGELLGVSAQAVSKWERGICYPDISFLPVLAQLFECTVNDFFETTV